MHWLILSLICALCFSLTHVVIKAMFSGFKAEYLVTIKLLLFCSIFMPFLFIFSDSFTFDLRFIISMFITGVLVVVAQILYMRSIQLSTLSDSVPIISLTPLLTIPFAWLLIGELPEGWGISGVILIVAGTYILNFEHASARNLAGPLLHIFNNRGVRYMFYVSAIYGLGSALDKYIVIHYNVLSRLFLYPYFAAPLIIVYLYYRDGSRFTQEIKTTYSMTWKPFMLLILLGLTMHAAQFSAISMTYTAYVIAIKRTAAVFSIILAFYFFNEKSNFRSKILGASVMCSGVAVLSI